MEPPRHLMSACVSDVLLFCAQDCSCRRSRTPSRSRAPVSGARWTAGGWRSGSCGGSERRSAVLRCVRASCCRFPLPCGAMPGFIPVRLHVNLPSLAGTRHSVHIV